jgi:iron complex transport system substrate-binding protein
MKPLVALGVYAMLGAALAAPPKRIVSTAPSITEILYALGLGDSVAGVTTYCRYPPEAARKPKVGTFLNPNLEAILSLQPDLVISGPGQIPPGARMPQMKLRILEVPHDTVADLLSAIGRIGEAAGAQPRAARLQNTIREGLAQVQRTTAQRPRVSVMFVIGRTPGRLDGMVAVGPASYLNEVLRIAGGRNTFEDAAAAYPRVNLEEVLARQPEVIIDMGDMADPAGITEEQKRAVVTLWDQAPSLLAVKTRRVHAVASDIFVVPGPRVVEAAREFARLLHPEARP